MILIDRDTGEKFYVENIRCLQLKFDTIKRDTPQTFELYTADGVRIATISRDYFDDKTRSKLDSLSEFEIARRTTKN